MVGATVTTLELKSGKNTLRRQKRFALSQAGTQPATSQKADGVYAADFQKQRDHPARRPATTNSVPTACVPETSPPFTVYRALA